MKAYGIALICLTMFLTACVPRSGEGISVARPTATPIVETESAQLEPEPTPTLQAYPALTDYYPTPTNPQTPPTATSPGLDLGSPNAASIQPITNSDQLRLPQDLLYIETNKLMRWRSNGQIELLAGPLEEGNAALVQPVSNQLGPGPVMFDGAVLMYDVAADGRTLVYLRWRTQITGELVRHNLVTGETAVLTVIDALNYQDTDGVPNLLALAISPDGQWAAYMTENIYQQGTKVAGWASSRFVPAQGGPVNGTIWVINIQDPQQPQEIGQCIGMSIRQISTNCRQQLQWSADSQKLYWYDTVGVWQTSVNNWQVNMLLDNSTDNLDHDTDISIYIVLSVDPSGQYLLLRVSGYEGGSQAILNIATGVLIDIPDSFAYILPGPELSWLSDGRLFALRGSESNDGDQPPTLEIWRIANDELVLDTSVLLPVATYGLPRMPGQLADGRLTFVFISQNEQERGIYVANLDTLTAQRISDIAPNFENYYSASTHWSPTGDGLLFEDSSNRYLFYIPSNGSGVYDLLPLFFEFPHSFTWLPS